MSDKTESLSGKVLDSSRKVEEIKGLISTVNQNIDSETAREIIEISNSVDTILELVVVINGVSDKIRKLADTTNEQSRRITQSVNDMAERINSSGTKSQRTVESIGYINSNISKSPIR